MTLPPTVSNCLWLRDSLKQKFLLCICQLLMYFLSINLSSFPHECLASTASWGEELHSPFISLCMASFWLYLMLPAVLLKGGQPINPCLSSSSNSGLHIWPSSWLICSNLAVLHKEAIPYFWSSSLLLTNLYPVIFLLSGGEGTAQS